MKTLNLKSISVLLLLQSSEGRKRKYGNLRILFRGKIPLQLIKKKSQVLLAKEVIEKSYFPDEHDISIAGEFPKQSSEDIPVADVFRHLIRNDEKARGGEPVLIESLIKLKPENRMDD